MPAAPDMALERAVKGLGTPFVTIGDSTIARSAEEAIHDGVAITRSFLTDLAAPSCPASGD